jgi:hypothetical protein
MATVGVNTAAASSLPSPHVYRLAVQADAVTGAADIFDWYCWHTHRSDVTSGPVQLYGTYGGRYPASTSNWYRPQLGFVRSRGHRPTSLPIVTRRSAVAPASVLSRSRHMTPGPHIGRNSAGQICPFTILWPRSRFTYLCGELSDCGGKIFICSE